VALQYNIVSAGARRGTGSDSPGVAQYLAEAGIRMTFDSLAKAADAHLIG
jgi:hypothetical protein